MPTRRVTRPRGFVMALIIAIVAALALHVAAAAPAVAVTGDAVVISVAATTSPAQASDIPCPAGDPDGDPHCSTPATAHAAAIGSADARDAHPAAARERPDAVSPASETDAPTPNRQLLSIDRR